MSGVEVVSWNRIGERNRAHYFGPRAGRIGGSAIIFVSSAASRARSAISVLRNQSSAVMRGAAPLRRNFAPASTVPTCPLSPINASFMRESLVL